MAETTPFLRNRYWVLRHGKSIPNERGIIVSSMENGTLPEYQLAPEGVSQAQSAGQSFQKAKGTLALQRHEIKCGVVAVKLQKPISESFLLKEKRNIRRP